MKKIILFFAFLLLPIVAQADFNLVPTANVSSSVEQRTGATSSTAIRNPNFVAQEKINQNNIQLKRTADTSQGAAERTGATSSTAVTIHREKMRPALEVINERYVPENLKEKYKMTDDYVEMASVKPAAPIVVEPPPSVIPLKKKRLEIIGGPPPVMASAAPKPAPIVVPAERFDTWRARKGELLKDVLKRWSDRAGTDFVWTAAESPKISKEFSYVGTFDKAVVGLMKQDAGQLKSKFSDGDEAVAQAEPIVANDNGADMRQPAEVVAPVAPGKTWFASSGASLQGVLQAWAETEGATLVWQADQSFAVRDSLNEKGSFEAAVETILSKYEGKKLRPVGQLYKNPVSGEKVLVIKTDKAG